MAKETEIDVTGGQQEQVDALAAKVDKLTKSLKKNRKETYRLKSANRKLKDKLEDVNKSMGILGTKSSRNAMTFSVLRSKLLMFNFMMAITIGKIMSLVKAAGAQERALKAVE